ncbi:nudC domain-containing protein 1 [Drosophila grimshawi]|uniref:NudC domain-containing protein 1 n=1 Tax=Drosophila grimshawi TaxID=7222 RepID=B4JL16_DROGR|nr:nudC domain-containing protein 1 [Drosophila grimshawi]EDW00269.1 GH12766 [Drosophila grimshawi]
MSTVVDLNVDRNLLCPKFDGYKLSFDAVPVLRQSFDRDPFRLKPHANQYSLLHVELFARHNLLQSDPWARHSSYYVNDCHQIVLCSYDELHGQPREQRIVYTLQRENHGDGFAHLAGDYNYTLRFISEKYCVLCDGMLALHLLETGDRRRDSSTWQLVSMAPINVADQQRGFVLLDARLDMMHERKQISIAAGHVQRMESGHAWQLIWSRWTLDALPDSTWMYNICERLQTTGSLYYCAFEPRAESLVLCSNHEIQTKAEAEAVAARLLRQEKGVDGAETAYSWSQTNDDIVVRFPLPSNVNRNDLHIQCTQDHVLVEMQEQAALLDGGLFASVAEELTTWTVEGQSLQLTLVKRVEQLWPQLLLDAEPATLPAEQHPAATEESSDSDSEPAQLPIPNLEDPIEECDFPLGDSDADIKMVRFNLSASRITHTILLGAAPPLFATTLRAGYPAAFATRQGVDASIWLQQFQPARPDEWGVRHEGNLHAFGYVQASKRKRKFIDCCPELDYAVITEDYRHVYIYKPRYDSAGGLRNRNGPQVVIGKQNLVTLDHDVGEVMGLATAPNVITILTENALLYLQV